MATIYLVNTNMRGYLPVGDPIECETLIEAKQAARQEALYLAEETEDKIEVWSSLNSITKCDLVNYGVPIIYAVIGDFAVWIAIVSD